MEIDKEKEKNHRRYKTMTIQSGRLKERTDFQQLILSELQKHNGYRKRNSKTDFNPGLAMDTEILLEFLKTTQPDEIEKLESYYNETDGKKLIEFINKEIMRENQGTLHALKNGIEFNNGVTLKLMYGKPTSQMNLKAVENYNHNILTVMEEVWHKEGERLDLVIFLNGIAIFTFELKCNTSGQTYEDAINQYKFERNSKTRTLMYKHGALAHFAMDLNEVYAATRLQGRATVFRPFNKGRGEGINCGKGNPGKDDDIKVEYIWNDLLTKDTIFFLIENIIFINKEQKEKDNGQKYTEETLIFPRFQQLNAVRKITADILKNKTEKNYLIQHSAGSGKTNTIAWLAHQLYTLHDAEDNDIFDTVCVITDRRVVDQQLQRAISGIDHQSGVVQLMDEKCNSESLKKTLEKGAKIIVSTINKFSYICDCITGMQNKRFAVIIDEAHSSTSGTLIEKVEFALSSGEKATKFTKTKKDLTKITTQITTQPPLAVAETAEYQPKSHGETEDKEKNTEEPDEEFVEESVEESTEDKINREMKRIGKTPNVSFIAFTATPKETTLDIFGVKNGDERGQPFDLYSMKQAIEENFILDVLENYTTYQTYYQINKKIEDDPELETTAAKRKIFKLVDDDAENIRQKCAIILDHFVNNMASCLNGQAKAMIVTSSRKAAVRYHEEINKLINEYKYNDSRYFVIHTLVAFSGKLTIDGEEQTETKINGFSEDELPKEFDKDTYQILIVANKYQTGFDQKKLCAMYVDKKLHGVAAVQTLSRLNRYVEGKQTFIIDFKNTYEDIVKAFAPYYTVTLLEDGITPSDVREIESKIDERNYLFKETINRFNEILYSKQNLTEADKKKLWSILSDTVDVIKDQYKDADEREVVRKEIKRFLQLYTLLIHATSFRNADLHKKYNFLSYLIKELKQDGKSSDFKVADKITIYNIQQKKTGEVTSSGIISDPKVKKPSAKVGLHLSDDEKKKLSEIIDEINQKFNKEFDSDVTTHSILEIRELLRKDEKLRVSAANNKLKDFKLKYFNQIQTALVDGYENNKEFFDLLLNNPEMAKKLLCVFAEGLYNELREEKK